LSQCYSLLDLTSVWIDYPAVAKDSDVIRRKITELETGSTVTLEKLTQGGRVSIVDNTGYKIGLLSEAASSQWEGRLRICEISPSAFNYHLAKRLFRT
jgi:hypothetical protein